MALLEKVTVKTRPDSWSQSFLVPVSGLFVTGLLTDGSAARVCCAVVSAAR